MIMITRSSGRGWIRLVSAGLVAVTLGTAARAGASDLSFTLTPQDGDGRVAFAGGAGSDLAGSGLGVDTVTGLDTPLGGPSSAKQIVDGTLAFNTGAFTGGSADGTDWNFGAQGSRLTLSGSIPSLGIDTSTTLLQGGFSGPSFVKTLAGGDLKVQGGAIFSVVNPTLAASFGLPTGSVLYDGGLALLFAAGNSSPSAFSSSGFTGGTLTLTPVPEPGTFAVFAAVAAVGLAWRGRRRSGIEPERGVIDDQRQDAPAPSPT